MAEEVYPLLAACVEGEKELLASPQKTVSRPADDKQSGIGWESARSLPFQLLPRQEHRCVRLTGMRGLLVTVEGVEGSGKSTQCSRLADRLQCRGLAVVLTSEPDGTEMGAAIRRLFEAEGPSPSPLSQVLLFMAARQQHVVQVIRPALAQGMIVISDRYADATLAYQGFGHGVDLEVIRDLNVLATGGLMPDLTLVLDLDPAVGMSRIKGRPFDAFEKLDLPFHRRVREGYLEIARTEKRRVVVLPGVQDAASLAATMLAVVDERLGLRDGKEDGERLP
jgi:dTMP kinase